jgi:HlyD family secretion protein
MKHYKLPALIILILISSCNSNRNDFDASGNFEADEVIVSAQQTGQILSFNLQEGDSLAVGAVVGQIDVTLSKLQKQQAEANVQSLHSKTSSSAEENDLVKKQLIVQEVELDHQMKERTRIENLVKSDAATQKQLDDINALVLQLEKQVNVTKQQIKVNSTNTEIRNNGILSDKTALEKTVAEYQEQINKGQIVNPINGTVLTKYALTGEMALTGKPLYKIANTDTLTLKAYLPGDYLSLVKIGEPVAVRVDQGKGFKNYTGAISWIAAKSEFTPKTIQTKNERSSLVYAIKIRIKNDGFLKIGMYGEVKLDSTVK